MGKDSEGASNANGLGEEVPGASRLLKLLLEVVLLSIIAVVGLFPVALFAAEALLGRKL